MNGNRVTRFHVLCSGLRVRKLHQDCVRKENKDAFSHSYAACDRQWALAQDVFACNKLYQLECIPMSKDKKDQVKGNQ